MGWIPGWGTKIPYAMGKQPHATTREPAHCNEDLAQPKTKGLYIYSFSYEYKSNVCSLQKIQKCMKTGFSNDPSSQKQTI